LLNAQVAYTAKLGKAQDVTLAIVGNNLLDSDMRNAASFKKDEVLLPGRSVRFAATLVF
jgi:iron complex outermembrane receptor protein